MEINEFDNVIKDHIVYGFRLIASEKDAIRLGELSRDWAGSGALLERPPKDMLPTEDAKFYLLENPGGEGVAGFGLHKIGNFIEIKNLCVSAKYQGKGLGSSIVRYLIQKLELGQTLVAFSAHSFQWFLKLGFSLVEPSRIGAERLSKLDPNRASLLLAYEQLPENKLEINIISKSTKFIFERESDSTILDAAIRQGVDIDYLCESGICGTCMHKVKSGTISRSPLNLGRNSDILICETVPMSNLELD